MRQVLVLINKEQKKLFHEFNNLNDKKVLVDNTANIKREAEKIAQERAARQAAEQQRLAQIQPGQMDLSGNVIKIQTTLPNHDPDLSNETGWAGVPPVQQVSAQPTQHASDYLQGKYPEEFWSLVGNNPNDTQEHGASRHRVDDKGNYLQVSVRGKKPTGDLPTRGPARPRKGRPNYPQDYGVRVTQKKDMPSQKNIVVQRKKAIKKMVLVKEEDSVCPNCQGTGKDPNEAGRPEIGIDPGECEPCDGSGMLFEETVLDERGFPIESYEENDPNWQDTIEASEPMDIALRLLKHAVSPAAKKHKHDYDTKYESSPERRKYRTELTQERRKRHVDGKGGKDMSHTVAGTIVPEDMHTNRARHFKERGTLKKTVAVVSYSEPIGKRV